jgi:hypothetical protein
MTALAEHGLIQDETWLVDWEGPRVFSLLTGKIEFPSRFRANNFERRRLVSHHIRCAPGMGAHGVAEPSQREGFWKM